jgi:hypothetical protein
MKQKFLFISIFTLLTFSLFAQVTDQTMQQIKLLLQEKNSRTPAQQKIDSRLLQAVRENRGEKMVEGVNLDRADVKADNAGILKVDIKADITDAFLSKITALGGRIIFPSAKYHTVRASVNLKAVETIAGYPEVKFIEPAVESRVVDAGMDKTKEAGYAERVERVREQLTAYLKAQGEDIGKVTSQGDATHGAANVRTTYGYLGAGIKVGVLSDSYNATGGAAADVASGDLPGTGNPDGYTTPVTVVQDFSGGSDEGRAMLQVIHDLAPAALLYFATADVSEAGFATNIQALRNTYGCNIIIDDVGYFDEAVFQDGIDAQAVDAVTAAGALYFSAAGNSGSLVKGTSGVFEGDFNDAGSAAFTSDSKAGTIHNFGTVASPVNGDIITAEGEVYNLTWSDPYGASTNDYDLFLISKTGTVKGSSTNVQSGTQNPYEQITPTNLASGDRLVVFKTTAAAVRAFHLNTNRGTLTVATNGQTSGHPCAIAAFCMAATPATTAFESGYPTGPYPNLFVSTNKVEPFSSDGPRRIFYNPDGSAITAGNFLFGTSGGTSLSKPDLTAADGVSTTFASSTGLNPFFGTSCAGPHAGAIAALLLSANPSLTTAQVRTILTSSALDIEGTGYDNNSGYGIIQAIQAVQALPSSCGVPTGLTASSISATGATTGWTAVTGANSYTLQYKASTASSYTAITGLTTNSDVLTGLTAATKYYFEVETVCSSGTSAFSTLDSFTTSAPPCTVPTGLTANSITATGATVGWTAVSGANSYNLEYGTSLTSLTAVNGLTTNSDALSGLASSTKYYFEVQTVCSGGNSAFSAVDSFTTTALPCTVPTGLNPSSITTTGATVGWTAVSGANSYNLEYGTSLTALTAVNGLTTNSDALSSLASNTKYYFEVQTVCSGGSSAFSIVDSFTTAVPPCTVPTGLNASSITATAATAGWTAVTGAVSYTLKYGTSLSALTTVSGLTTNSDALSSLTASTKYYFEVETICSANNSNFSTIDSFTTSVATITYCASKGTSTAEFIKTVALGTINNTTANDGGYGNFTSLNTSLTAGKKVTITLTPSFASTKFKEGWTVFIDYNQDGTLNGTGETVATGTEAKTAITKSFSFTVPKTALNGATRMRIQLQRTTASTNPCAAIADGDVQDFTVTITGGTPGAEESTQTTSEISQDNIVANANTLSIVPNPIQGSSNATAVFKLAKQGNTTLQVIDLTGRVVYTESLGMQNAGQHNYLLNSVSGKLNSGYYLVVLEQNNQIVARNRFIVAK